MKLRSIKQLKNICGKRILVRVDFDVPMKKGKVDKRGLSRVRAALPTINYLREKGARIILCAHLGRPDGKINKDLSAKPLVSVLEKMIGIKISWSAEVVGKNVQQKISLMKDGEVLLLENIRFNPEEEKNTKQFSKELASLADVYVNDAFGVSHREHASTSGVMEYLPSYAGLRFQEEVDHLLKLISKPKKPLVVILGGAKLKTKLPVLKAFLKTADQILVGGGIANTIFDALGYGAGDSLMDRDGLGTDKEIVKNKKIIKPVDVIVLSHGKKKAVLVEEEKGVLCYDGESIMDIGPVTSKFYASYINKAKTIIWNGPLGVCEDKKFVLGTQVVARAINSQSKKGAFVFIGGGDTVSCVEEFLDSKKIWISTGGGAMLKFLAGSDLPVLKKLKY